MRETTRDFAACREEARLCGERAAQTQDAFARRAFLDLQQRWLRLADTDIAVVRVGSGQRPRAPAARPFG